MRFIKILSSTRLQYEAIGFLLYYVGLTVYFCLFSTNHILGAVLFFSLPGLYLLVSHRPVSRHALVFSLVSGSAIGLLLQVLADQYSVWGYEPAFATLQILQMPVEAVGWYVLWMGFVAIIHMVFVDKHQHQLHGHSLWSKHGLYLLISLLVFVVAVWLLSYRESLPVIEYAYLLVIMPLVVIPTIYYLCTHRQVVADVVKTSLLVSIPMVLYELIGLHHGWWVYAGTYVGSVTVAGQQLPYEEVVAWLLLGAAFVVVWYEVFEGDGGR